MKDLLPVEKREAVLQLELQRLDMMQAAVYRSAEDGDIHAQEAVLKDRREAAKVVREFMRSPDATPLIERSGCIQHDTVFIAKVRPAKREESAALGSAGEARPDSGALFGAAAQP
jgi:hypothetical protein